MIVPMKKVSLVVMEKDSHNSLERLKEAGVLHIGKKSVSSPALGKLLERRAAVRRAAGLLRRYPVSPLPETPVLPEIAVSPEDPASPKQDPASRALALAEEKKNLQEQLTQQIRERRRIEGWGDFDPKAFALFIPYGITLLPYELSLKQYAAIGGETGEGGGTAGGGGEAGQTEEPRPEEPGVIVINRTKQRVRLLAVNTDIPEAVPFALPECSLTELNAAVDGLYRRLAEIEAALAECAQSKAALENELTLLEEQIEFETARAGMETLEGVPAGSAVSWLSGFVPAGSMDTLKKAASKNAWALQWEDPSPDDRPPTLIRNNPLVRIVQPLFSFLGTVPGYREYDISASYLLFFCLFFAMIFGDGAYGLILFLASFTIGILIKIKSGKMPDAFKLFMLLSLCTVGWGAITGAWFAMPADKLPSPLRALVIPPFNGSGPLEAFPGILQKLFRLPADIPSDGLKTRWNIQFLCFTVGIIQMSWGRLKNIKKFMPSPKAFAQAGWLVMMIGLYFLVLFMLLKVELPSFAMYFIFGGLASYFILAEQGEGNFFGNILKSFSNILSIALNAVGSFADIISYIRLFAVGLAGSSIAESFNAMAIPAEGFGALGAGFVLRLAAGILILVLGHGLNIMMNALSVIVHGVRLNLLEYAGNHLGMEWSGYAYNPFASRTKAG